MKTFKQFINSIYINEGLTPEQKKEVDSWPKSDAGEKISGHVIPPGQSRITIPLEGSSESVEPHPEVKKHLEQHGYEIHDYKKGLALEPEKIDKTGVSRKRPIKIGKALDKTGASEELKKTFVTHSNQARKGARTEGLQVVISRHPHDVAGMSTGQGWTSCMEFGEGENCHYLAHDVEHGTHVAYLTKAGQQQSENPADHAIARIALKPHHGTDGSTILHPESVTYGDSDSSFEKTVGKWASKNFPVKSGVVYKKNPEVYDDTGIKHVASFDTLINHPDPHIRKMVYFDHPDKITPQHISQEIDKGHPASIRNAMSHPMANSSHVQKLLDHPKLSRDVDVLRASSIRAANHDQLSDMLDLHPGDESLITPMSRNKEFGEHHIHQILKGVMNLYPSTVRNLAGHRQFNSDNMTKILNIGDSARSQTNPNMEKSVKKLFKNHKLAAMKVRPDLLTKDKLNKIVSDPHEDQEVKDLAQYHLETSHK